MADLTNGIRAVAAMSFVDNDTGIAIALQATNQVVFNPGITQEVVYASNELGIEVPVRQIKSREDPTFQVTFPRKNLDSLSQALNRKWVKAGSSTPVAARFIRQFTPTANSIPGVLTGFEGFALTADPAGARASANIAGVSEQLAVEAFATHDPVADTKSFAVGAAAALKFSNDVVGNPVVIDVPYTVNGLYYLGEQPFANLSLTFTMIMDDFKLVQMRFPRAAISQDNTSINFAEGGVQVTYRSIFDGTRCVPYDLVYLGTDRGC
jgi:hypothetical protein